MGFAQRLIAIAQRLRIATHALHSEVERAGVMRLLLRGQLELAGYCKLPRNLHTVYAALEAALSRHAHDPGLAASLARRYFAATCCVMI